MATYEEFDLVAVPFPFTDRDTLKRRPALVLSSAEFHGNTGHLILAMVTTAKQSAWPGDVWLQDWREAGLPQESLVRAKLFTLDARFVLRVLGTLTAADRKNVAVSIRAALGKTVRGATL